MNNVELNHCANPYIHLENKHNNSEWGFHEYLSNEKEKKKSVGLVLSSHLKTDVNGTYVSWDQDRPDGTFITPTSHWNLILLPFLYGPLENLINEWLK